MKNANRFRATLAVAVKFTIFGYTCLVIFMTFRKFSTLVLSLSKILFNFINVKIQSEWVFKVQVRNRILIS